MPKERRMRSVSFERRSRASPFPCSSSSNHKHSSSSSSQNPPESAAAAAEDIREWEESRCPVCMEYPHNAVLLLCSSHDKGCRTFMCDTSYRHSNCLDQFRKSFSGSSPPLQDSNEDQQPTKLSCPLCRGRVTGWTVVEPARRYLNAKTRSCSLESCGFTGPYRELRKHARTDHPSVRPSEVDPERQRDWRRMERQRDLGDLLSTIQSAFGGEERAVDGVLDEDGEFEGSLVPAPFMVYFIVRFQRAGVSGRSFPWFSRGPSRGSSRSRRRRTTILWGETYDGEPGSAGRVSSDGDDGDDLRREDTSSSASQSGQGRTRRRLRMPDDDDDDDDLL